MSPSATYQDCLRGLQNGEVYKIRIVHFPSHVFLKIMPLRNKSKGEGTKETERVEQRH